jgi:hypothetical protein
MLAKAQNPRSYSSDAPYGHRLPAREIIEAGPRVNLGVAVYAIEATGPLVWELLLSGAKPLCRTLGRRKSLSFSSFWSSNPHHFHRADVKDVHHSVLDAMGINRRAARTSHQGAEFLRWHPFGGFPKRIFSRGKIPLIAPRMLDAPRCRNDPATRSSASIRTQRSPPAPS